MSIVTRMIYVLPFRKVFHLRRRTRRRKCMCWDIGRQIMNVLLCVHAFQSISFCSVSSLPSWCGLVCVFMDKDVLLKYLWGASTRHPLLSFFFLPPCSQEDTPRRQTTFTLSCCITHTHLTWRHYSYPVIYVRGKKVGESCPVKKIKGTRLYICIHAFMLSLFWLI